MESCQEPYHHDLLDADTHEEREALAHQVKLQQEQEHLRRLEELELLRLEAEEKDDEASKTGGNNEAASEDEEGEMDDDYDDIEYDVHFSSPDIRETLATQDLNLFGDLLEIQK